MEQFTEEEQKAIKEFHDLSALGISVWREFESIDLAKEIRETEITSKLFSKCLRHYAPPLGVFDYFTDFYSFGYKKITRASSKKPDFSCYYIYNFSKNKLAYIEDVANDELRKNPIYLRGDYMIEFLDVAQNEILSIRFKRGQKEYKIKANGLEVLYFEKLDDIHYKHIEIDAFGFIEQRIHLINGISTLDEVTHRFLLNIPKAIELDSTYNPMPTPPKSIETWHKTLKECGFKVVDWED